MTQATKSILEQVKDWPVEDQDELAAAARIIEARRRGEIYSLSDEERAAILEGFAEIEAGQGIPETEIRDLFRLHRNHRRA